ncbi:hypothetical protein M3Y94_00422500 [Aphelenchoides besseyi]|nr:hypothetical protein M3Y94_00422500 [Aphelenchoides besseyi]KAI6229552.1 hypothetical protein M3Y95_00542900 [Aphelenchoides besseyi]
MMFAMWPDSPRFSASWPPCSSLENVEAYPLGSDKLPIQHYDYEAHESTSFPSCSTDFNAPTVFQQPTKSDAATQTEEIDERDRRCRRVTLAMLRSSFDLEVRLELNVETSQRTRIGRCLDVLTALFAACYRPIVINGP